MVNIRKLNIIVWIPQVVVSHQVTKTKLALKKDCKLQWIEL